MKNNNEIYILHAKIEENLVKLHKRKIYAHHATPIAGSGNEKSSKTLKWDIIKRQLLNQQNSLFTKASQPQEKTPQQPLSRDELLYIINRTLILQHIIIQLNETVAKYSRLPLLCIFFQCALAIVFNSYNLVVFLLKAAYDNGAQVHLKIAMLLFFYGFHITTAFLDTLITVIVHQSVQQNIRKTGSIMDEMNLYISDDGIKLRLSQFSAYVYNNLRDHSIYGLYTLNGAIIRSLIAGTTTYIIILIQYSGDGEICKLPTEAGNKTTTIA